jgi:L-lactate utilization protein LutC
MGSDVVPLRDHLELRIAHERELREANDRRYCEVQTERQRALAYKESADALALELARTHQSYLDMKANELREQINRERILYATKEEIAPLLTFVAGQQGSSKTWIIVLSIALAALAFIGSTVIPLLTHR